jgi:protease II
VQAFVECNGDWLYMVTNAGGAADYKLVRCRVDDALRERACAASTDAVSAAALLSPGAPLPAVWTDVIPARPGVRIEDIDMFRHACVLYERAHGVPRVAVLPLGGDDATLTTRLETIQCVPLLPHTCTVHSGGNADPDAPTLRLAIATPTQPEVDADYHFGSRELRQLRQRVLGKPLDRPVFIASDYTSYVLRAPSHDGERVPLTVVHRADLGIDVAAVQDAAAQLCAAGGAVDAPARLREAAEPRADWRAEWITAAASASASASAPVSVAAASGTMTPAAAAPGALWSYLRHVAMAALLKGRAPPSTHRAQTLFPAGGITDPGDWRHNNPALLHFYGAYGHTCDADFSATRLPLLSRGWVSAFAHARGGGELGTAWYHAGRQRHKRNTFEDAVACARLLVATGLTRASLLATRAESAGGLVSGVLANEHPWLFRAHVLRSPFLDVLGAMLDPGLPLTVPEFLEWGDPADAQVRAYMASYSPLSNVVQQREYPAILALGGMNDARVPVQHMLRYTLAVRRATREALAHASARSSSSGGSSSIAEARQMHLCMVHDDAGHFGVGGHTSRLADVALEAAFLFKALDLDPHRVTA